MIINDQIRDEKLQHDINRGLDFVPVKSERVFTKEGLCRFLLIFLNLTCN